MAGGRATTAQGQALTDVGQPLAVRPEVKREL
jgi:hypothetical protein